MSAGAFRGVRGREPGSRMHRAFRPNAVLAFLLAVVLVLAAPGVARATACHDLAAPVAMTTAAAVQAQGHAGMTDHADDHRVAGHCTGDGLCCIGGCAVGLAFAEPWRLAPHLPRVSHIRCDLSDRAIRGVAVPPALGPPRQFVPV